jgi:hypothetical protein
MNRITVRGGFSGSLLVGYSYALVSCYGGVSIEVAALTLSSIINPISFTREVFTVATGSSDHGSREGS